MCVTVKSNFRLKSDIFCMKLGLMSLTVLCGENYRSDDDFMLCTSVNTFRYYTLYRVTRIKRNPNCL
jgi:hypothetical protein